MWRYGAISGRDLGSSYTIYSNLAPDVKNFENMFECLPMKKEQRW